MIAVIPPAPPWQSRIANYQQATKFPPAFLLMPDGIVYGWWTLGNDYRVRSGYHGGYPATYLRRIRALFPEKQRVLHLFSGRVDLAEIPGDTVDLRPELQPTFLDDAQSLCRVPLHAYDLVLADPPYSGEDAEHYGTTMVRRNRVMRALAGLQRGAHVAWLDQVLPIYRKDTWAVEAEIAIRRSTNHRFREVTIFRRR